MICGNFFLYLVQRRVTLHGFGEGPVTVLLLASSEQNTEINADSNIRDSDVRCSKVESLAITGSPSEDTGVTSFVQEACTSMTVLGDIRGNPSVFPVDGAIQDLKAYFARPRCFRTGTLSYDRNRLYAFAVNSPLLFSTYFPGGIDRLKGVYGIRPTLVFTLQVASTPFHMGVLSLGFQYGTGVNYTDRYVRSSKSATATNIPHVRLDLSTDTMVQLRVPYLAPAEYFTTDGGPSYDLDLLGVISLNPILPISAPYGTVPATYQLFVHMEDIQLFGATPEAVTNITPQAGKLIAKEFEDEAFPFSSGTMALSRTVKWFSKGIPMVSSIGGPTSWFLEKAAGAIRSFGFSRPAVAEPTQRMFRVDNIGEHNVDVATTAQVVAPTATNSLAFGKKFTGTDVDEMSLSYVTSQWSQINVGTIPSTTAAGTAVYATAVSPSCFWFRTGTSTPY